MQEKSNAIAVAREIGFGRESLREGDSECFKHAADAVQGFLEWLELQSAGYPDDIGFAIRGGELLYALDAPTRDLEIGDLEDYLRCAIARLERANSAGRDRPDSGAFRVVENANPTYGGVANFGHSDGSGHPGVPCGDLKNFSLGGK